MLAKIEQLLQEIEGLQAANAEELEALRIKYLSKKGAINELMAEVFKHDIDGINVDFVDG